MAPRLALLRIALLLIAAFGAAPPAGAQNPFETVARVNDSVVTRFEVGQRERLMQVLRVPGTNADAALQALIDDRLKMEAARSAELIPTEDQVQSGLDDFAARVNLSSDDLLKALADVGIQKESVRDYIRVLVAWGDVIRERYSARARPSEAEIDRAMDLGGAGSSTRVLLSEIVLPVTPDVASISQERAGAIAELRSFDDFAAAARRFSVAESRNNGGRLDWMPLSNLPPQIAPMFLSMQPGDVTPPIPTADGIVLYQLRGIEDARPSLGGNTNLDYAIVRFPPGTNLDAEIAKLRAVTDTCDDLYGIFKGAPESQLMRKTEARSAMPGQLALRTDLLDPGEMAAIPPQAPGDGGAILMLCARAAIREQALSREDVQRQLFVRRLESFGDSYLAQLRADAFIEIIR
ncbi:MAG: peptidylprolyl isomerase [Rhodobacteraceae bacterium]|nr:peptidylprolyl isomerase [Paracoccaceae bacterium]